MSDRTAAVFDASDSSSPLSVPAGQTALFLMDYLRFLVNFRGDEAKPAAAKGKEMRDWALRSGILPIHFSFDLDKQPPATCKSIHQMKALVEYMKSSPSAAAEPEDIVSTDPANEPTLLRVPGIISVMQSAGLKELLAKKNIKSIILCGISTSGCVLRTACDAANSGYIVSVIGDACWDPIPGMQEMLVEHALPMQAHCASAADFQKAWSST